MTQVRNVGKKAYAAVERRGAAYADAVLSNVNANMYDMLAGSGGRGLRGRVSLKELRRRGAAGAGARDPWDSPIMVPSSIPAHMNRGVLAGEPVRLQCSSDQDIDEDVGGRRGQEGGSDRAWRPSKMMDADAVVRSILKTDGGVLGGVEEDSESDSDDSEGFFRGGRRSRRSD